MSAGSTPSSIPAAQAPAASRATWSPGTFSSRAIGPVTAQSSGRTGAGGPPVVSSLHRVRVALVPSARRSVI